MLLDQRRRDNSYLVHTQSSDGPSTSGSVPPRREKGLNIWWNIGQGPNICIELFALASFFGLKYSVESFRVRKGGLRMAGSRRMSPGRRVARSSRGEFTNNTGRLTCSASTCYKWTLGAACSSMTNDWHWNSQHGLELSTGQNWGRSRGHCAD